MEVVPQSPPTVDRQIVYGGLSASQTSRIPTLLPRVVSPKPVAFPASPSKSTFKPSSGSNTSRNRTLSSPGSKSSKASGETHAKNPFPIISSHDSKILSSSTSRVQESHQPRQTSINPTSPEASSSVLPRVLKQHRSASYIKAALQHDEEPMPFPHHATPSGIPISKNRSASGNKAGHSTADAERSRIIVKEEIIMNELPPFRVKSKEVEKSEEDPMSERELSKMRKDSSSPPKRDRLISGLPVRPGSSRQNSSGSVNSRPSTATPTTRGPAGKSLGLGQPSNRKVSAPQPQISKSRSPVLASGSLDSSTPRSISLGKLSSPSSASPTPTTSPRLGVAAHFIPPETTYTPPKGTNWDEVLLPTVAKKLGMSAGEPAIGGEGDLAVEWDKDGTPIKWVKQPAVQGINPSDISHKSRTEKRSQSSFSSSFESSPDNPFRPEPISHQSSHRSFLRHKRSSEALELQPIRTTLGQSTSLSHDPMTSLPPPLAYDNLRPIKASTSIRSVSPSPSRPPILSHKSSSLRQKVSPVASRQVSRTTMRQPSFRNPQTPPVIQVQAATPGPSLPTTSLISPKQPAVIPEQRMQVTTDKRKGNQEEIGNGCQCIIM